PSQAVPAPQCPQRIGRDHFRPDPRPLRPNSDAPGRRRDVRHPLGRRRRRRVAPPPPPGGGGRPRHPRAPDRTAHPMTRLTRVDLATASEAEIRRLTRRSAVPDPNVRRRAAEICEQVRERGDAAVSEIAQRVGGGFRRVTDSEMDRALARLDQSVREALEAAIDAVAAFHRAQLPEDLTVVTTPGVEITREWSPLRRVGAYVPGGKAAYPSSAVMTVVPARVAGVEEIVVASPEDPEDGVPTELLAACRMAGATEVWAMGGAQAVAALAYGTETVTPVDKIVGPGNAWVTAAKLEVFGICAIDLPAGPSEVLVLADGEADPRLVAADLLCQAEHGPDSPAVLVTTDEALAAAVER